MNNLIEQAAAAQQGGRLEEAAALYRKALQSRPDDASLLNNLAGVLDQLGRLSEAISIYRKAANAGAELAVPHFNLGEALLRYGKPEEALAPLRAAATLEPDLAVAWANLGAAHLALGEPKAAMGPLRRAASLDPNDAASRCGLGDAHQLLGREDQAVPWYTEAVGLDPKPARSWYGLGRALLAGKRYAEAHAAFERCLEIEPGHAAALHDSGKTLFELGCVEDAMPLLRRAAREGPPDVQELARESLAIIVPGSPSDDNASILQIRREWASRLPTRSATSTKVRPPGGPLRIGYVSAYFPKANWMKPVWAVVNRHDRTRFEVHLFADAAREARFDGYRNHPADRVHLTAGLSNEEVAKRIALENIDILVDLNGFSVPRRLAIFALRPARIQLAWFNLYATSGMPAIDAIIGDDHVIPPDEERFYCERVERVPGTYLAFEIDHPTPQIVPPPVVSGGRFTFGSLASQYKITNAVVASWSAILQRCPEAHLLLRNATLGRPENCGHLLGRFAACGIGPDRLTLEGPAPHLEFLSTYNRIDCALDPFPYSGGTTTTEAIWQGVPVLTFDAGRWAGRTSVSLMRAAGLGEFIARDQAGYENLAVQLATSKSGTERLAELRGTLREMLRTSSSCDAEGLTRALEACYTRCAERRAV